MHGVSANSTIFARQKADIMKSMKDLVQNFTEQLKEAVRIGDKAVLTKTPKPIHNVVITGLGGSGIGGSIVSEVVASKCSVPILVNKDYFLPAFVNENSLVIVSSYSGNTEETLQAMNEALKKNAKIVCITSGGQVKEIAEKENLDHILIPPGMPPRSCLGYSLTQLFFILGGFSLIPSDYKKELTDGIQLLENEQSSIQAEAHEIAEFLVNKIPVIYISDGYNGVATRFRQQINENSKMLCWHNILPEMNHNELVGWTENHHDCAVLLIRNKTDYSRTQARIEISKSVFIKYTPNVKELWSKGETQLERSLYIIHLTDWASCFLADKRKVDASEIDIINHLKGELSKI